MHDQIGPYQIQSELGRGGMGVVYLAHDARLDRDVAIKSLPTELAADPARLERFEREAKTLASLNHPNLAGIHGVEEQDGARYLVLEFVDGETLADRLDRGPLPVDDAVELAVQIAAGVEAAHDAGVIHRDLKPANIKITSDGVAKVLDFGLARQDDGSISSTGALDSPTITAPQNSPTIEGAILGTAAYMSPEQARGRRVDKRTDIWSFGVVLYEMIVGASPFVGETASDSIGAVLHKSFDLEQLPNETPSNVRRVLERCLERDKNQRYRDIGDVRIELLRTDDAPPAESASTERRGGRAAPMTLALALLGMCLVAATAWFGSRAMLPEPERTVRKFQIYRAGVGDAFNPTTPQISPDGMKIAFIEGDAVRVRDLSTFETETITEAANVERVAWSPNGRALAFATHDAIYRVPVSGGGATRIGDGVTSFAITWTDDDQILFASDITPQQPAISALSARGGTPNTFLAASNEEVIDFHSVSSIPGTDVVLYVRHQIDHRTPIEAWDGERSVVVADFEDLYMTAPVWSSSGHVLFARGSGEHSIWAAPFSPERMEVTGDLFLVQTDASSPSVSADGALSFVRGSPWMSNELIWVFHDGSTESIADGGELVAAPLVSPDGTRIAFAGGSSPRDMEIWVHDLERGINTRISSLDGFVYPAAWSPDGKEIAVMNFDPVLREEGEYTRFLAADGTGPTREPCPGLLAAFDREWKRAVLVSDPRSNAMQISAFDLEERKVIGDITKVTGGFIYLSLSPDGEYLLYESRESSDLQVYCTRFPSGEGRWQVSSDGGRQPQWAPDGSALYYQSKTQELMRVEVTREPSLRFGIPQNAFPTTPGIAEFATMFVAPDGERFVSVRGRGDEDSASEYQLLLIENWYEEFRDEAGGG